MHRESLWAYNTNVPKEHPILYRRSRFMNSDSRQNLNMKVIACLLLVVVVIFPCMASILHSQDNTALMQAIEEGKVEQVLGLLERGADANACGWPTKRTGLSYLYDRYSHPEYYIERTALMLAAIGDSPAIVELLLAHGANVDADVYDHTMNALSCA